MGRDNTCGRHMGGNRVAVQHAIGRRPGGFLLFSNEGSTIISILQSHCVGETDLLFCNIVLNAKCVRPKVPCFSHIGLALLRMTLVISKLLVMMADAGAQPIATERCNTQG